MVENAFSQLEVTTRSVKRAQYEAFEFQILGDDVLVRNESHATPSEHEYRVTVTNGVPVACECPADERFDTACKHRIAVAIRTPVLDAVRTKQLAADGGVGVDEREKEVPEDCDCAALSDDFPCWECVRTGRREVPETDSDLDV